MVVTSTAPQLGLHRGGGGWGGATTLPFTRKPKPLVLTVPPPFKTDTHAPGSCRSRVGRRPARSSSVAVVTHTRSFAGAHGSNHLLELLCANEMLSVTSPRQSSVITAVPFGDTVVLLLNLATSLKSRTWCTPHPPQCPVPGGAGRGCPGRLGLAGAVRGPSTDPHGGRWRTAPAGGEPPLSEALSGRGGPWKYHAERTPR